MGRFLIQAVCPCEVPCGLNRGSRSSRFEHRRSLIGIDVAIYCELGLKLEGLRSGLLLNSVQFETVDQILSAFAVHAKAGLFSARKERTAYRPALPPLSPALCRSRVQYAERARAAPC